MKEKMQIEAAIEILEKTYIISARQNGKIQNVKALALAINALRDKEEKNKGEWIPINEETIKTLQDRYYYLVAHKDYTTPLKAKFYKDLPPYFKVCTFNGNFVIFIFSEEYCEITQAMKLPELPKEEEGEE